MKPILYSDIDGVLFADYSGHFQLRPDIKGWLAFAHEHFEVRWLSTWTRDEIRTLLSILYAEKYLNTLEAPAFQVADWYSFSDKELWLAKVVPTLKDREWIWIDDNIPSSDRLAALGLDAERCVSVDPKGAGELDILKLRLLAVLSQRVVAA